MDRSENTNHHQGRASGNTPNGNDAFDLQTLSARGLKQDFSELSQAVRSLWTKSGTTPR